MATTSRWACRLSTSRSLCSGGHAREHVGLRSLLPQLLVRERVQLASGHGGAVSLQQPELLSDGAGRPLVVAGDHLHRDARALARLDGGDRFGARRNYHALQSEERETALDVSVGEFLQRRARPPDGERQNPHPGRRQSFDLVHHELRGIPSGLRRAATDHRLRSAFQVDDLAVFSRLVQRRHVPAFGLEGDGVLAGMAADLFRVYAGFRGGAHRTTSPSTALPITIARTAEPRRT